MILLDTSDSRLRAVWETAIDLSRRQPKGWTIIGAQMVALHAIEHRRRPPRQSLDLDLLVNVRVLHDGTGQISRTLLDAGFRLLDPDSFGIGHRFDNGSVEVDVLAPDGLSRRAGLTTIPPARTLSVPGGTQALLRTELVDVTLGDQRGTIPRPNLLGAILIKARAVAVDDVPSAQLVDLAFLLSLVENPRSLAPRLKHAERRWLRERADLLDPGCAAWRNIDDRAAGLRALRVFSTFQEEADV